jgi:hypothetical protein
MNKKLETIITILQKDKVIIFLIFVLAYLLRVLPYLLGYDIPFTEDGIRDFQQVKYLIDNNQINYTDSYQFYGAFPVLHLITYAFSRLGIDALKAFLFVPQVFASLGIIAYYLFLKKYFSIKHSLIACFLIAVFISHIHWTAQPVRETIGLSLFPLIIYLFDREIRGRSKTLVNKLLLLGSTTLMIFSHHWSVIMTIGWMVMFSLFFVRDKKQMGYGLVISSIFALLTLEYWYFVFPQSSVLIEKFVLTIWSPIQLSILVILAGLVFVIRKYDINKLKTKNIRNTLVIIGSVVFVMLALEVAPIDYPLQIWLNFAIFLVLIFVGFFNTRDKHLNNLMFTVVFYLFFPIVALANLMLTFQKLSDMPFDPFRVFEFAIFPLSIVGAMGMASVASKIKYSQPVLIIVLIVLGTLTYPTVFIYKNNFVNTPFYDIRSDIRYISPEIRELIHWANDHDYNVISNIPEIRSYQATFLEPKENYIHLVTNSGKTVNDKYELINDPIIRVDNTEAEYKNYHTTVKSNEDGALITKKDDAQFVDFNIPETVKVDSTIQATMKMKNTGITTWYLDEGYRIVDRSRTIVIPLTNEVKPGEVGIFKASVETSARPRTITLVFQLRNNKNEIIGGKSPDAVVKVVR